MDLKIKLIDVNEALCDAWQEEFKHCLDVKVIHGSIFDHPSDVIVSPSNSFGFFNGGIDHYIAQFFKNDINVQESVQKVIRNDFDGELLVGQSLMIPTNNKQFPNLLCSPTMRVPMTLSYGNTMSANIYLATKAIFVLLNKMPHTKYYIKSIAIPGLGTGVGGVSPKDCAKKMLMAYDAFHLKQYEYPNTLGAAGRMHYEQTRTTSIDEEAI